MHLTPRTSLFIFLFFLAAWFSGILVLDFYRTGRTQQETPTGYIGIVIDPQHAGIQHTQEWVHERVESIIHAELARALPADTKPLPSFLHTRNHCHTTLAYLKKNSSSQLTAIAGGLRLMLEEKPFLQTPFYLSSQLTLFGLEEDTIVMTLHDPNQLLHMLHPYIEATLAHVSNQLHTVLYTPWETIGEFIPHITVTRIDFESLKELVVKHGGDGEAVEEAIREKVEATLTRFVIPDTLREVPGNAFTLFDRQEEEYETFVLKKRK